MLQAQSYATGGWGPDETLRAPGSPDVYNSLTNTHASFETPCGSYAHFKVTRYLLRATRDAHYGDSMERTMYNTVLGALPLKQDGRNFYYSDYNFDGERVYKEAHWACCSGTLPQVAADYGINSYFRAPGAVYVNLYVPSTLRWTENGTAISLSQVNEYPFEEHVSFRLTTSKPLNFTLHLRIPAWAQGAQVSVNGAAQHGLAQPGEFAAISRQWKTGDTIELELPLKLRLEPIDAAHPATVALLRGPIVLMAVKDQQSTPLPALTQEQLLAVRRISSRQWQVNSANGPVTMLPFTEMGTRPYSTYLKLS
jgi:hypothetical protein